jgi:hypothetical protein
MKGEEIILEGVWDSRPGGTPLFPQDDSRELRITFARWSHMRWVYWLLGDWAPGWMFRTFIVDEVTLTSYEAIVDEEGTVAFRAAIKPELPGRWVIGR